MSFENDLKQLRMNANLTQEALATKLHVTRQTVSNWENGKNMPNLETLHALSDLFQISLEKLLFSEDITMMQSTDASLAQKIDQDVKLKRRYRLGFFSLMTFILLIVFSIGILIVGYHKGVPMIDRINPFLSYQVSYTKLPHNKSVNPNNKHTHGYWSAWFTDDEMGRSWTKLTLTTGLNPGVKSPYVMAYHKGSYVKSARIVPKSYVNKSYLSNLTSLDSLLKGKANIATNSHSLREFKTNNHVSNTVQQLVPQ